MIIEGGVDVTFPEFDLEDLDGKTLYICVGTDTLDGVKTTVVMGVDMVTGNHYFITEEKEKVQ